MTPNNNLSILPFYTDKKYQDYKKDYAQGDVYPLVSLINTVIPFQIMREYSVTWNPEVLLYKGREGNSYVDITQQMIDTGLSLQDFQAENLNVIQYRGVLPMTINMSIGEYYIRLYDGISYYYSEVFTIVSSVDNCLKIEYWDYDNFIFETGVISYESAFKNILYLQTELGRPEYPFEEDGENRDLQFFVKKQLSEKTFKFGFLSPEYLLDAMRVIRMHDNITITNRGQVYNAVEFLITPTWEDGGYLASVEAEFQSDTVVKKLAVSIPVSDGDFNNDFNDDFKIN